MISIYATLDSENRITGYGNAEYGVITVDPKDSFLISIPEEHEILLNGLGRYKLINGNIIKDTSGVLEKLKESKKSELSLACQKHILAGFDYEIKNITYHFSYDQEAQMNLQETDRLFLNDMITSIVWSAGLGNDKARIALNKKGFNEIYLASVKHKQDAISRFRDKLMPILNQASTVDAVNLINWDVEIVEPSPEPVIFKTNNMIDKQIDDVKVAQAQGNIELLQIIFGMGGMF